MKATFFALFLVAGIGLGSLQAMNMSTVLVFETSDGKSLEMELMQEMEYTEEVPRILRESLSSNTADPENHAFFQSLVVSLQKEEEEDPLPFKID